MNSSLQKALIASMLVVGGTVSALGQGYDYDANCIDMNNTAPYSTAFITYYLETPMWSAGMGAVGTVNWNSCIPGSTSGGSVPVPGRFEFGPGPQGTVQDDFQIKNGNYVQSPDNAMDFQWGQNHGWDPADRFVADGDQIGEMATSGAGWSFALIEPAGTYFGSNGFELAYKGASNRYFRLVDAVSSSLTVICQVDVIADTSHFMWTFENTGTTPASYGLDVGQWVFPVGGYLGDYVNIAQQLDGPNASFVQDYPGIELYPNAPTPVDNYGEALGYSDPQQIFHPYIYVPGRQPLQLETQITRASNPSAFPNYIDITGGILGTTSPTVGGGIQYVLSPYQNVEDSHGNSDQTPVDEFEVGDVTFLLDGTNGITTPKINDVILQDTSLSEDTAIVEKWYPSTIQGGGTNTIVAYYRSIWGDSNYYSGYGSVVDTPKVLAAQLSATTGTYSLNPNPFDIRVDIDNTGFFSQVYGEIPMDSVEVDLNLPPGMYPAGGSPTQTVMKQFLSSGLQPVTVGHVDFQVQSSPYLYGPQQYTVTITPTPGNPQTISGTIYVAATPTLQLLSGPNLVTEPWNFAQGDWGSVLNIPVTSSFQAYNWDPQSQQYTVSSGPQREIGTWIVATNPPAGFFNLAGSPTQPNDEFPPATGAPNLILYPGWNLVGNPYNYSFPLGQLVGVVGNTTVESYDALVSAGALDGSFAYYDPDLQTYDFLGADTDELLPNHGYWVYAAQQIYLKFPPIYDLYTRGSVTPAYKQYVDHWKFQMSTVLQASSNGPAVKDLYNYYGVDTTPGNAKKLTYRKPPIAAGYRQIRAFLTPSNVNYNGNTSIGIGGASSAKFGLKSSTKASIVPEYSEMTASVPGKQVFNYNVFPTQGGAATLSWPNLNTLPKNIGVTVKDLTTGKTIDGRTQSGYNFEAEANRIRTFQVTLDPLSTIRQEISNITTQVVKKGTTKDLVIGFTTSSEGVASLALFQNGNRVANVATNMQIVAGANSVTWGMVMQNGSAVKHVSYTLVVTAVGDGGDTATKYITLNL